MTISIGGRLVGGHNPPLVIAEIAQAHDGSLGIAHAFIDAVAKAGGHAIKFQTHIAEAESTPGEPFRVKFSRQDATRYDYWKRMEFTPDQWRGLYEHAHEVGLIFISSPFSTEAVDLLAETGIDAYKVGSGETNNPVLMRAIAKTGKPVLVSSGMSTWDEITETVGLMNELELEHGLFQCTSMYPTPYDKVGLNVLKEMMARFDCPVGLSDHTASIYSSLAAVTLGATMIEIHVTFHDQMFGPDVSSSLSFDDFSRLMEGVGAIHNMRQNPVDKDGMAQDMARMRSLFNKSVAVRRDLPAGTQLTEEMLTVKKPGTGIPARDLPDLIGKTLARDVTPAELLTPEDIA